MEEPKSPQEYEGSIQSSSENLSDGSWLNASFNFFLLIVHLADEPSVDAHTQQGQRAAYENFSSIDWSYEAEKERARLQRQSSVRGFDGVVARFLDNMVPWVVTIGTGVCVGLLAGYLDVLSAWLSDLRLGICPSSLYLSEQACCTGLEGSSTAWAKGRRIEPVTVGESCNTWKDWGDVFDFGNFAAQSLLQYSIYLILAVRHQATAAGPTVKPKRNRSPLPQRRRFLSKYTPRMPFIPAYRKSRPFWVVL